MFVSGFWQRLDVYNEQPDIHYKHQLIIFLQLSDGDYITWSTYQNFNKLQMEKLRVPLVKVTIFADKSCTMHMLLSLVVDYRLVSIVICMFF